MVASLVLEPGWTAERSLVSVEAPQASGRLIRGPRGKGKGMSVRPHARGVDPRANRVLPAELKSPDCDVPSRGSFFSPIPSKPGYGSPELHRERGAPSPATGSGLSAEPEN